MRFYSHHRCLFQFAQKRITNLNAFKPLWQYLVSSATIQHNENIMISKSPPAHERWQEPIGRYIQAAQRLEPKIDGDVFTLYAARHSEPKFALQAHIQVRQMLSSLSAAPSWWFEAVCASGGLKQQQQQQQQQAYLSRHSIGQGLLSCIVPRSTEIWGRAWVIGGAKVRCV